MVKRGIELVDLNPPLIKIIIQTDKIKLQNKRNIKHIIYKKYYWYK